MSTTQAPPSRPDPTGAPPPASPPGGRPTHEATGPLTVGDVSGPVFDAAAPPVWPGARWIGEVRVRPRGSGSGSGSGSGDRVPLDGAQGYRGARLLVRGDDRLYGIAHISVQNGGVARGELEREVARVVAESPQRRQPGPPDRPLDRPLDRAVDRPLDRTVDRPLGRPLEGPPMTVVLCTRERPEALRAALTSVLAQDYPQLQVIVVDNAPTTDATRRVLARLADPRVTLLTEPTPGLSTARNAGVAAASTDWIAFTDDDVVVDRDWLAGLARGIAAAGPDCACVTGFVATGELATPAQGWFDARIGWNRVVAPRVFRLAEPPADLPLFPFQVGSYGAGANFAARADVLAALGGFDTHLGAGTATKGGEDIDLFFRVVLAGHALAYEPSALVWHRHRDDVDALVAQAVGYGRGFSAWATKTLLTPGPLARGLGVVASRALRHPSAVLGPLAAYRSPLAAAPPRPDASTSAPDARAEEGRDARPRGDAERDHADEIGVDILAVEHRATWSGPPTYLRLRYGPAATRVGATARASARRAAATITARARAARRGQ